MRTIYKYEIDINMGLQEIEVIAGGSITHIGEQDGKLCFWKEGVVGPDTEAMKIQVFGTGHIINDDDLFHWASVQMSSGLVWHVYTLI